MRKKALTLPALALMSLFTMAGTREAPEKERDIRQVREWTVDGSHTEINFSVKHFFTPVTGTFDSFEIQLMYDAQAPENSTVNVRIDVASVDTDNERRDNHLRSTDFFDAETYPFITFESTSVQALGSNRLLARGNLTIKETTQEVELAIDLLGIMDLPPEMSEMMRGITQVASFTATTRIDRRDFQVGVANWAQTVIVGGDVDISIGLEANHR